MKLKTIIHIGQHKTGTTSIQHFLRANKKELIGKGLYVPDVIAGYDNPSHFILNVYALNECRYSSMKERLLQSQEKDYFLNLKKILDNDIYEHYQTAENQGCKELIWSNEGLFLLNSIEEYKRLKNLFEDISSKVTCVCCFRDVESYSSSYMKQLKKQGIQLSNNKDSYRYLEKDSWLFDYKRKIKLLEQVFDEVITFSYQASDNVQEFLKQINYSSDNTPSIRLNPT